MQVFYETKIKKYAIVCFIIAMVFFVAGCSMTKDSKQEEMSANKLEETSESNQLETQEQTAGDENKVQTFNESVSLSNLEHLSENENAPVVYFTSDISSEGILSIYQALNWNPGGKIAVKVSTGESERSNYLRGDLIGELVSSIDGTIVECMTAYGGSRAEVARAKQTAEDHGFTAFADFDLQDEEGEVEIPFDGGARINRAIVGSHIDNYDYYLILSHFKGHAMAGFGGGIKNVAIGMSSKSGKVYVHTAGERTSGSIMYSNQDAWLEALPETVMAISNHLGEGHMLYISVMNRLSVDCDCDGNPSGPDMHDIGILASYDPVALDQACVDFVYAVSDGDSLIKRMKSRNGIHALEHGEEIGLGSRSYRLENIDE